MKTIITTAAFVSVLMSGTAFSGTVNNEIGQLGQSTDILNGSHFVSKELVSVDSANLPENNLSADVYLGNN